MKLFYVTPFIEGAGGVQRVLSIKTNYLIEKWGYEISILATNSGIDNKYYEFNDKINFYSEKASGKNVFYLFNYSKLLKKYIEKINPDIIVVCDNGFKGYCVPFLISKKHKIIFECHGTIYTEEKQVFIADYFINKFYQICASKFAKLVVLVEDFKNEFETSNLVVISNPIWFTSSKIPDYKAKKVIAVGRHSHQKGFDIMLSIWQKVVRKHSNWILEIYGESNPKIDLKLLSDKLGISKNVKFHNPSRDINEKYLEASFLILTSRYEGFGMVLIEAMQSGLACISFDCRRGPKDIISNNYDGFLIEPKNERAFEEKIIFLIENENLRVEMGRRAKENSKRYNIDVIMLQWKNLFEGLIKN